MHSPWAAKEGENPQEWSIEERNSRITYHRLLQWATYKKENVPCLHCRRQGANYEIKDTPIGTLCLECWLDWPACEICGVGARESVYNDAVTFKGQYLCAECLVPEISDNYKKWSLNEITSMRSNIIYIMYDLPVITYRLTGNIGVINEIT